MGFGLDPLYTPKRHVTGTEIAVFDTSKGTIRVQLDGAGAPIHVANFCELAESGFYDDTKFHRYVPGFVIQGGDPYTREMNPADVAAGRPGADGIPGTGGPGYRIKAEFASNPHNFTSVLDLSTDWIQDTLSLARRLRVKPLSLNFEQEMYCIPFVLRPHNSFA